MPALRELVIRATTAGGAPAGVRAAVPLRRGDDFVELELGAGRGPRAELLLDLIGPGSGSDVVLDVQGERRTVPGGALRRLVTVADPPEGTWHLRVTSGCTDLLCVPDLPIRGSVRRQVRCGQ